MENEPIEKKKVVSKGPIWKKSWESLEKGNLIPYLIMVDSTNMWVTIFSAFLKSNDFLWNKTENPGKFSGKKFLDRNSKVAQSSRIFWKFRVSKIFVISSYFHKFHILGLFFIFCERFFTTKLSKFGVNVHNKIGQTKWYSRIHSDSVGAKEIFPIWHFSSKHKIKLIKWI